jgi:hypothetical protein
MQVRAELAPWESQMSEVQSRADVAASERDLLLKAQQEAAGVCVCVCARACGRGCFWAAGWRTCAAVVCVQWRVPVTLTAMLRALWPSQHTPHRPPPPPRDQPHAAH